VSETVQLVGLDFGTTTSSALVATARLTHNALSGRFELDHIQERFRSDMVFTPLSSDDQIDEHRIEAYLDAWLAAGEVRPEQVFGGGALLTGLTAQRSNADALVRLIRRRLGSALVATADDPCLESWLTFMGSSAPLSRIHPQTPFLNLDIGGGTTNLALGLAGEVLRTGCLYVGARHIQVVPGTYRIVKLSRYAVALLIHLGIHARVGDVLKEDDVSHVLGWYTDLLQAAVSGRTEVFAEPLAKMHEQVAFRLPEGVSELAVTFSGGVGELIYAHLQGKPWPSTTYFGDLGIDLARRLVDVPRWADSLRRYVSATGGRATVYGLLRHSTEISGSTVFLPNPSVLPLTDLPILGSLGDASTQMEIRAMLELVRSSARGGCVRITFAGANVQSVRALGTRLGEILQETGFPDSQPLVLLVRENLGKVLGHYVTQWGKFPRCLVVIDEISHRDAQYAHIGAPRQQVIPVSFYGLNG
jgi:ethanolamine utilization protein EutA